MNFNQCCVDPAAVPWWSWQDPDVCAHQSRASISTGELVQLEVCSQGAVCQLEQLVYVQQALMHHQCASHVLLWIN